MGACWFLGTCVIRGFTDRLVSLMGLAATMGQAWPQAQPSAFQALQKNAMSNVFSQTPSEASENLDMVALRNNYLLWPSDCPGHDWLARTLNADQCAQWCSSTSHCVGFSYEAKSRRCIPKVWVCPRYSERQNSWRFFQRLWKLRLAPQIVPPRFPECAKQVFDAHRLPLLRAEALPEIGGIFIAHYPPLKHRRSKLERRLKEQGLDQAATWVTWINKKDILAMPPDITRDCLFTAMFEEWAQLGTRSLVLKVLWVLYWMLQNGLDNILFLEDDAELPRDFVQQLQELSLDLPQDYTVISLAGCLTVDEVRNYPQLRSSSKRLFGPGLMSRGDGGLLISRLGASMVLDYVFSRKADRNRDLFLGYGATNVFEHLTNNRLLEGNYWYEPRMWEACPSVGRSSHASDEL